MAIFPVILCGGSGTRLWPLSRPTRPKQFVDLTGPSSLFEDALRRVGPLAGAGGRVLVVAGRDHLTLARFQVASAGLDATIIVEPGARDSAPAMAAAARWIADRDPDGVALFVASDHHIPDADRFRTAAREAITAARQDRIVTFGVKPTEPSSAYGYIRPETPGLSPVARFVEKPDGATAERYVADGYLWNSGNFAAPASLLLAEIGQYAPGVLAAIDASVGADAGDVHELGEGFLASPKISIDYAVMERSGRVWVLPVDYPWSDLGAWDAVAATGAANRGLWIGAEGDGANLVRAAEGMVVATAGVSGLAIVAEPDAVLVCDLSRSQEVKSLVERIRLLSPGHAGTGAGAAGDLVGAMRRFDRWMRLSALPLWATLGVDADGGFVESLTPEGEASADFRRARVQARQAYVYGVAGSRGWAGPSGVLANRALDRFDQTHRRPDGLYRTRAARSGEVLDDTAWVYDQAFTLLALAGASSGARRSEQLSARARRLAQALDPLRHAAGGWREAGDNPYQANAHMHLLEACLAWETQDADGPWRDMADEIVALARDHFIDQIGGFLREFFQADWTPAAGSDGDLVEPGHQFEWAWLLVRWARARQEDWPLDAARRLHAIGERGVDAERGVAMDALNGDLSIRYRAARLWPQTERLKSSLILAEIEQGEVRAARLADAASALAGLWRYLQPSGLWFDTMNPDGGFAPGDAPASSLYHIAEAWRQVDATRRSLGLDPR